MCLLLTAILTQLRQFLPTTGHPHPHPAGLIHTRPSPAVPLIFIDTCPAVMPITCSLGPSPPSLLPLYCLLMNPIVPHTIPALLLSPLPSPKRLLSHVSHSTLKGLAWRARRSQPTRTVFWALRPEPDDGSQSRPVVLRLVFLAFSCRVGPLPVDGSEY